MSKPVPPEKLNVCIVARHFPITGRASGFGFLRLIARGLAARGHSVTVLSGEHPQGRTELNQEGVSMHFLLESRTAKSRRDPFPELVKAKFIELHDKKPFHIIHSVDNSAIKITRSKDAYRVAVAFDVAATQMSQLFALLGMAQETLGSILSTGFNVGYKFLRTYYGGDRYLLSTADGIFVTSPRERMTLERYYLYPDARIHTVPYGIEIGDGDAISVFGPSDFFASAKRQPLTAVLPVSGALAETPSEDEELEIPESIPEGLARFIAAGDLLFVPGDIGDHRDPSLVFDLLAAAVERHPDIRILFGGKWGPLPPPCADANSCGRSNTADAATEFSSPARFHPRSNAFVWTDLF